MAKVRYKDISDNYEKLVAPSSGSGMRKSIGYEESVKEYYLIPIDDLIPYEKQARRNFSEEELNSLADTIREYGVRTPLSVVKSDQTGKYRVISGERRLRAAKIVGLQKLPCIICEQREDIEEIALIENIQRANLHPVELAEAYNSLLDKYNHGDQQKLVLKLGVNKSHVSETLKIALLPGEIKNYLLNNNIKSRQILRKLIKCDNLNEMRNILGIIETEPRKIRKKNLINFYVKDGKISMDLVTYNLTSKQKEDLKGYLFKVIETLK